MGKSLNGKELGKGLSQRKDGLYQGRFVNRFGKKQTVYAKTLNEVRQKLRKEQYEDEKAITAGRTAIPRAGPSRKITWSISSPIPLCRPAVRGDIARSVMCSGRAEEF